MQRHGRTSKIAQSHTTEKTRDREQTEKGTERQKQPSQKPPQSIPPKKERITPLRIRKSHIETPSENIPEKENPTPSNFDMDFLHPPPDGSRLSAESQRF